MPSWAVKAMAGYLSAMKKPSRGLDDPLVSSPLLVKENYHGNDKGKGKS
jgi:hypothetical protein